MSLGCEAADSNEALQTAKRELDEERLLAALRLGEAESYELLVRACGKKVLNVAQRLVGNTEDASACAREAFLQAFKNIERFEGRSSLWTWLHRKVVNAALLKLRARHRRKEDSLNEWLPEFDALGCRVDSSIRQLEPVEKLLQRLEVRTVVRRSIEKLPERYRTVLVLRDMEGFDIEETAKLLGITPGAVKTLLHRARCGLKKLLEPVMQGGIRSCGRSQASSSLPAT